MIYHLLDIFFVVFHTSLIIFNLSGWIWKRTRIINLITLGLTGSSWLFLGMIFGTPGYCPLTDWHFNVLWHLGKRDLPDSYIKYMFERLTGIGVDSSLADRVTLFVFLSALFLSLILNLIDLRKARKTGKH
jgi:hypothetical protein